MRLLLAIATLIALTTAAGETSIPNGWYVAGTSPDSYQFSASSTEGKPAPSGHLRSNDAATDDDFGTAMQAFDAINHLGKRIKLTAFVKTGELDTSAAIWMRVDSEKRFGVSFDNMEDRPIKANTDWAKYAIVLDVPNDALKISFGAMIVGSGEIWFDQFKLQEVDRSTRVTSNSLPIAPVNTDFSD